MTLQQLTSCTVVITTFTRLSTEWTAARSGLAGRRNVLLQVGCF